ncbi:unnamed protein product [Phyllotreta striolata]|uniref:Cytochrome P450 n=1 Tax=Phyllotreta striolata TaxID=444603 RepID=A0A9N9TMT9_PHYSR|nr:unnamed protein product [Phyllotreta striolata]
MFELLAVLFVFIATWGFYSTIKPRKYPPGPVWYPFVGSAPIVKKLAIQLGGLHKAVQKLSETHKTDILGLKLGDKNTVIVSNYALLKDILWKEEYAGRPDDIFIRLRCLGQLKGITMTDGSFSRIQKKFVKTHLRELGFGKERMEELINEESSELMEILEKLEDQGIDFTKILPLSVMNVLWAIAAGTRMDRYDNRLITLLNTMQERSRLFDLSGGLLNQFPWLRFVAPEISGYNLITRLNKNLKEIIMESIEEHKKSWIPGQDNDLIYAFINKMNDTNDDNSTFTEDQLVMICLDLFIAGSVSTSNTLGCAFLFMILNPEIQSKVAEEVERAFAKNENIHYKERNRVPYVEAVLNEVHRFSTIGPIGGPRRVTSDVKLGDYEIPKNTMVLYSIYSCHNDKDYWKDPEVFRPERFLTPEGTLINHERFMPFSIGIRRCLGEVLARSCVFTFFCEIIRNYEVIAYPGTKPTGKLIAGMLTGPESYMAKLVKRNKQNNSIIY